MKKPRGFAFFAFVISAAIITVGCSKENSVFTDDDQKKSAHSLSEDFCELNCLLVAPELVTPEEVEMLRFMREEEKLARDVYLTFSDYNLPVFTNISASEQTHMDRVLCLLVHYNIEDPASQEIGVFTNQGLQLLFNELTDLGALSLTNALFVGATIEDKDIHDINELIDQTDNDAIISVFTNLLCGSGNHLRAFYALLTLRGLEYDPQFISQLLLDETIESEHQYCGADL